MTQWCATWIDSSSADNAGSEQSHKSLLPKCACTAVSQAGIFISTMPGEPAASLCHGSWPGPFVVPSLLLIIYPCGKLQHEANERPHREQEQLVRMKARRAVVPIQCTQPSFCTKPACGHRGEENVSWSWPSMGLEIQTEGFRECCSFSWACCNHSLCSLSWNSSLLS